MILTFNGKFMSRGQGKVLGYEAAPPPDPYNPLNLPPNTIRVRTNNGNAPIKGSSTSYETATLVSGTSDVYDVYKSGTSFANLLRGSYNVVEVLGANTTGITSMERMFLSCSHLPTVPLFDTSSVTDMSWMFDVCSELTTVPLFDTSKVTTMASMFIACTNLTSVPLLDTSSVTDMSAMFSRCSNLTTVPTFDTSSVTSMSNMFSECSKLTSVPLLDTSNVTTVAGMFYKCSKLRTVPTFDTSSVTSMQSMFEQCILLSSIPLFNTSSVTNINYAFQGCFNVESGALALYQQASSQANPPAHHGYTFYECGRWKSTGQAELAQIPSSWGGTGA